MHHGYSKATTAIPLPDGDVSRGALIIALREGEEKIPGELCCKETNGDPSLG